MSTEVSLKGKAGGRALANTVNDADSIMPLLFATIGNPTISFKKMAAMDKLGRTESSLEHRFRKWRQQGRDIAAENPENAGTLGTTNARGATTKKPRAPAKKVVSGRAKGPVKQADVGDEEDEEDEIDKEAETVKQEQDEMGGIGGGIPPHSNKGKAAVTTSTKKRTNSGRAAVPEDEDGEAPAKKAKVAKKGTAQVVKKSKTKYYSDSEDEDEDEASEYEEKMPSTPKGKGKAAVNDKGKAAAKPTGPAKMKKSKADMAAEATPIHEDEDADTDINGGDVHNDGMIDMQFDEAA